MEGLMTADEFRSATYSQIKTAEAGGNYCAGYYDKSTLIDMDCLALGLTETLWDPLFQQESLECDSRLKSAVRLDPPLYWGLIKSSIN